MTEENKQKKEKWCVICQDDLGEQRSVAAQIIGVDKQLFDRLQQIPIGGSLDIAGYQMLGECCYSGTCSRPDGEENSMELEKEFDTNGNLIRRSMITVMESYSWEELQRTLKEVHEFTALLEKESIEDEENLDMKNPEDY